MFAQAAGHVIEYGRLSAPLDGFRAALDTFRADGGRGLNVTLPFKPEAFAYAQRHTPRAAVAATEARGSASRTGAAASPPDSERAHCGSMRSLSPRKRPMLWQAGRFDRTLLTGP